MEITADLHTHTVFSHGRGSIRDNALAAYSRGLRAVGIADHGPGHLFIGVNGVGAFRRMRREITVTRRLFPGMEILLGVEANIVDLDGSIDVSSDILTELDYLLVGYHKLIRPQSIGALRAALRNLFTGWTGNKSTYSLRRLNTASLTAAVRRFPVTAVTHPGLQVEIDTYELALVCEEYGTALEISSAYAAEQENDVRLALRTGVSFLVSSDAHSPDRVGDFTEALTLIKRLHIPEERLLNREGVLPELRRKTQSESES
jgi:putative hydrolase